jgi:hypothetical protein
MPRGRPTIRNEGDLCEECGVHPVRAKGTTSSGEQRFDKYCSSCHRGFYKAPWLKHRGDECEECGFIPMPGTGRWTLDVHHLDHDKDNNDPSNLMTLCKNCHSQYHALEHEYQSPAVALSVLRKFIKSWTQ